MFWKRKCVHAWRDVGKVYHSDCGLGDDEQFHVLYCPKCHKEWLVSEERAMAEVEKVRVREEYEREGSYA